MGVTMITNLLFGLYLRAFDLWKMRNMEVVGRK